MKTIAIGSIFVLFAIVTVIIATAPTAFADHMTASVSITAGSSVPGCEANNECFVPYQVSIDPGGEVTWSNDDTAAHTVTSGTAADGPDGNFDSSLFMAGTTFSVKFDDYEPGTYPYFCMVHPWMTGEVIVEEAGMHEEEHTDEEVHTEGAATATGMLSDGTKVSIWTSAPTAGERMQISIEFADAEHVNYDVVVTQKGKEVLSDMDVHEHEGMGKHMTAPLGSADPVDVTVTFNGYGIDEPLTGPVGEEVVFSNVVPEFGTIAVMILGVAIISIIAVTAKSRVIPKL
jgi:predicted secreted protein with PEFG-CTERM motif